MNRTEAKIALNQGKRVTHAYLSNNFGSKHLWVKKTGQIYVFEDGAKVMPGLFWNDYKHPNFNDFWEEYREKK